MNEKILELKNLFNASIEKVEEIAALDEIRVSYLGKNGSVTGLLKNMGSLSPDERKTYGKDVNDLKNYISGAIDQRLVELNEKALKKELEAMPEFDVSAPVDTDRGSYHPITLVQRQCENVFRTMGFTIEDYSEIVTDYECFEALNIPKFHPARDMQDTYYLENGQLLKSHTSAAQNAIYKKYKKALIEEGKPIRAIFPGRCFRNENTDACHENTFFQMEGVMVDKNISISNLIF
ncbi:MAG: phenylalanine--tRNA ligase subunit alpha, partial [Oscillospiraceae bacterium]|nr:phenylalanine--tRNA ligase subunit alpha [Oscillospiraceae bacterium]